MSEKELVLDLNDDQFDAEVLNSDVPVMVDFWAEWCGPCKMIAPTFKQCAEDYKGKVKFVKINVDDNSNTPTKYGVRGIPTLMLFKEGALEATKVGAVTKTQLSSFIDSNL
jgi:thioredoxin 1